MTNPQHSSRSDNWHTPFEIIERVCVALGGGIDLDPASDATASATVRAAEYYTSEDDALSLPWLACGAKRVFINPPGGRGMAQRFWCKLLREVEAGNVHRAVFLAFSLDALQTCQGRGVPSPLEFPICVPAKRIRFIDGNGSRAASPTHASAIIGVGVNPNWFRSAFEDLGVVRL